MKVETKNIFPNPITAVTTSSSGNKKVLQITKNIFILTEMRTTPTYKMIQQGINIIEMYEGYREYTTFNNLWQGDSSLLDRITQLSFKVTYIGTAIVLLTGSPSRLMLNALSGMTISSWMLMAADSKQKQDTAIVTKDLKARKIAQCDLVVSTLEVISNVSAVALPIILSGQKNQCCTYALSLFQIVTKAAGIFAIVYKSRA